MRTIRNFGVVVPDGVGPLVEGIFGSGQIASGPYVEAFQICLGELLGTPHLVTTNNMSSAIEIALRLAGVGYGDGVATTSFACLSTNAPIRTSGAHPVWVDVDPETGLMLPSDLKRKIPLGVKAVLLYHLAGYPAEVGEIARICREGGVKLIEDCDNAILATDGDRFVGSFGDLSILSFYPNRLINAGDGGGVICRSVDDFERAKRLSRYGIDSSKFRDARGRISPNFDVPEIGWGATMSNLCSAIGLSQIASAPARVAAARNVAALYGEKFASLQGIKPVPVRLGTNPAYWVYLVLADDQEDALKRLIDSGVQATPLHDLAHRYSGFSAQGCPLPGTEAFFSRVIGLPCGWWMSASDVDKIAEILAGPESGMR